MSTLACDWEGWAEGTCSQGEGEIGSAPLSCAALMASCSLESKVTMPFGHVHANGIVSLRLLFLIISQLCSPSLSSFETPPFLPLIKPTYAETGRNARGFFSLPWQRVRSAYSVIVASAKNSPALAIRIGANLYTPSQPDNAHFAHFWLCKQQSSV